MVFNRSSLSFAQKILLVLLILTLSGCELYTYLKCGEVSWALKKAAREPQAQTIELAKLTKFEWDEMYVFSPYLPRDAVCLKLKLSVGECNEVVKDVSTDDGEVYLAFLLKGKVVHTEMYSRSFADIESAFGKSLTPATAKFNVVIQRNGVDSEGYYSLELIQ